MRKNPNLESLASCMDGIGAEIADATERPKKVSKSVASRQYTVRYIIPTVSSPCASLKPTERDMRVSSDSAADAVRAVKAAHPDADITGVD